MNDKKKVIILGAGIAGLSIGYFLSRSGKYAVTLLEKESDIGGLCASFKHFDFTLDYGAHKIYSVIPGILPEIRELMGDRLLAIPKKNRIFIKGRLLDYPLKLGNLFKVMGLLTFLSLGAGYAWALLKSFFIKTPPASYEDYMRRRFGPPTYKLILEPLADKIWGHPAGLHADIARMRVPASSGAEVILKLLGIKKETADSNAEIFYYPKNGFGEFPKRLQELIEASGGQVHTSIQIKQLKERGPRIAQVLAEENGVAKTFDCDYLISSIPLPTLTRLLFDEIHPLFPAQINGLQFRHLVLVYLFIKKPLVLKDQWIFFPEREFLFSRIFEQKQMNPALGPGDQTVLCCDFTCAESSWAWEASDESLAQKCTEGLVAAKLIEKTDVVGNFVKRVRSFYPRYDLQYPQKLTAVCQSLKTKENLLLTGRLGIYNYNNADHCFDMARFISEQLDKGLAARDVWDALEKRVQSYKIVD